MRVEKHLNLEEALQKAFRGTVEEFAEKNREVISTPRQWGDFGTTYRKNGEVVVGGYRNIVDESNLRDSQSTTFTGNLSAEISWSGNGKTPVTLQYYGWVSKGGKRVPGRPWCEVAAAEFNFKEAFGKSFKMSVSR